MDSVNVGKVTKRMTLFGWLLFVFFLLTAGIFGGVGFKYSLSSQGSVNYSQNGIVYYDNGIVSVENEYSRNKIEKKDSGGYTVSIYDNNSKDYFFDEDIDFYVGTSPIEEEGLLEYCYSIYPSHFQGEIYIYASKLQVNLNMVSTGQTLRQEYNYLKSGNFLKSYVEPPFDLKMQDDGSIDFALNYNGKDYSYSFGSDKKSSDGSYYSLIDGAYEASLYLSNNSLSFHVSPSPVTNSMNFLTEYCFVAASIGGIAILLIQLVTIGFKKDYKIRIRSLIEGWIGLILSIVPLSLSIAVPLTSGTPLSSFDILAFILPAVALVLFVYSLIYLIVTYKKSKPIKVARKAYLADLRNKKAIERQELQAKKAEEKRIETERKNEEKRIETERKNEEKARLEQERKEKDLAHQAELKEKKEIYQKQKEEDHVASINRKNEKKALKAESLKMNFALRPLYFALPLLLIEACFIFFAYNMVAMEGYEGGIHVVDLVLLSFAAIIMAIPSIIGAISYERKERCFFIYSLIALAFLAILGYIRFDRAYNYGEFDLYRVLFLIIIIVPACLLIALLLVHFLVKKDKKRIIASIILLGAGLLIALGIEGISRATNLDMFKNPLGIVVDNLHAKYLTIAIVELVLLPIAVASLYFTYLSLSRPLAEAELVSMQKRKQRKLEIQEEKKLEKEYDSLNKQYNVAIKNKDFDKAKEIEARIKEYEKEHGLEKASYFDGGLLSLFGWKILGHLLTAITFGIAYPWSVCFIKRWEVKHSVIGANRLVFTGTGGKLFIKYIVWWLLSIVTLGIFLLFVPIKMEKWVASHTFDAPLEKVEHIKRLEDEAEHAATSHNVDEAKRLNEELEKYRADNSILGESYFDGRLLQLIGWKIVCFLVNAITLTIAVPFTTCWMMKWKTKHQVILGRRLCFDGNGLQLIGRYIIWILLTLVTFGIYGLWLGIKMKKWETKHIHYAKEDNL